MTSQKKGSCWYAEINDLLKFRRFFFYSFARPCTTGAAGIFYQEAICTILGSNCCAI
nr:MAG TPA: hypothetical protein [Caudoviricetes sp.]